MKNTNTSMELGNRKKGRFSYGAFAVSLAVHGGLLLLIGGIVLVETVAPKVPFSGEYALEAGPSPVLEMSESAPPGPPDMPAMENAGPATPTMEITPAASFAQVIATPAPAANSLFPSLPSASSASLKALAGGGAPGGGGGGSGGTGLRGMGSFFGNKKENPNALVGYFYDLKQTKDRKPHNNLARLGPGPLAEEELNSFTRTAWRPDTLAKFYCAPEPLYAPQIFVPNMTADEAPRAYGVENEVQGRAWAAHYRGKVSPPATGVYRFVGGADDFLVVRVDGRIVLDGGLFSVSTFKPDLTPPRTYPYTFEAPGNNLQKTRRNGFVVGHKMELNAGMFYDIDILIGEGLGGHFYAFLYFEEEGATYQKDPGGNPILPIFRVADTAPPGSGEVMPPYLPNGPLWKVLPPSTSF